MGIDTKIQWANHTFNPWRGCTKVSFGCTNCYADAWSKRNPKSLGVWGPNGTRVIAAESYWSEPLRWNAVAVAAGERHRVFCASLADIFEGPETMPAEAVKAVDAARLRLAELIDKTPNLDWLLLTKRPENIPAMLRQMFPDLRIRPNIWLGTSTENQQMADMRIPLLASVPAARRFLSVEPLLGPINFSGKLHGIDWVIVGGESGPGARVCRISWIGSVVADCLIQNVALFVKQLGTCPRETEPGPSGGWDFASLDKSPLKDRKGGSPDEWPEWLRIRQIPSPLASTKGGAS